MFTCDKCDKQEQCISYWMKTGKLLCKDKEAYVDFGTRGLKHKTFRTDMLSVNTQSLHHKIISAFSHKQDVYDYFLLNCVVKCYLSESNEVKSIITERADGLSLRKIGTKFKMSHMKVQRILEQFKMKVRKEMYTKTKYKCTKCGRIYKVLTNGGKCPSCNGKMKIIKEEVKK